jgi:hypothetical protein
MVIRIHPHQLGFTISAQSGTLDQIKQLLNEHRTTIFIVAGALLVLAILRRR